jgi:hypothetical protein
MVFRDCIILHGKYGYDPEKASEYVLHHLSIGRPLNYHNIPAHLYWQKLESKGDPEDMAPAGGPAQAPGLFARADGGWAAGLHPLDRFVKNTYELLSPLHELTAQVPLTEHQFLTPDRRARRSVFGRGKQAVEVVVNASDTELVRASRLGGEVRLPPSGFLIEGPTFAAFCAESWNGLQYSRLACFTLRSLDAQPLAKSRRVRVFHAFGDARLRLGAREVRVERENLAELVRQEVRLTAPE